MKSAHSRATPRGPVITTLGTGDSEIRAGCHRYDDDRRVWSALRYVESVDALRLAEAKAVAAAGVLAWIGTPGPMACRTLAGQV